MALAGYLDGFRVKKASLFGYSDTFHSKEKKIVGRVNTFIILHITKEFKIAFIIRNLYLKGTFKFTNFKIRSL
jgi:hypothetical protein